MTEVSAAALAAHPFLHGMSRDQLSTLARTASDVTFGARHRIFTDGGRAGSGGSPCHNPTARTA